MPLTELPRRLVLAALVAATVAGSAAAQERMYNRGRHDVWVAFGQHRTGGDEGLHTKFWTELKAGTFVEIPRDYSGYVRVVAVVNGKRRAVKPTRPLPTHSFPILLTENANGTASVTTGAFGNEPVVIKAIQDQGHRAAPFYPLAAYRFRDGAPIGVLATEAAQQDLDEATDSRSLAVLALTNDTSAPVSYKFRWVPGGQWTSATLAAGKTDLWGEGYNPVRPEVEFDEGVANQARTVPVRARDVRLAGATKQPRVEDAAQYRFVSSGNRVTLTAKDSSPPQSR